MRCWQSPSGVRYMWCERYGCVWHARKAYQTCRYRKLHPAPIASISSPPGNQNGSDSGPYERERAWLRHRRRDLFRQEIADTVADSAEVESELRYLAAVLTTK